MDKMLRKKRKKSLVKKERSFVFITAIMIVSVLMIAVWEYTFMVSQNFRIAANLVKEVQAIAIARAAFRGSLAILQYDDTNVDGPNDDYYKLMPPLLPLGYGVAKIIIEAEDGKLNVNNLVQGAEEGADILDSTHYAFLQGLFSILGYEIKAVDPIVDFIDKNETSIGFGAEKDYYQTLRPPVNIKNGPLDTITELLMVKGISLEMFYGSHEEIEEESIREQKRLENLGDVKDSIDQEEEEIKVRSPKGLVHYLTVYGQPTSGNLSPININFMPLRLFQAIDAGIDDFSLKELEKFRSKYNLEESKHLNSQYFQANFGFSPEVCKYFFERNIKLLSTKSEYFRIHGIGEVGNIHREVEAVVRRLGRKGSIQYQILYYEEL